MKLFIMQFLSPRIGALDNGLVSHTEVYMYHDMYF
jgi:hypothetical protein